MNERGILISCFTLGILAQAILLIYNDWKWNKFALCLGAGLFGMMPGKHEYNYQPLGHIFFCLCIFAFVFAVTFKDDILPVISEKVLLSYSLIFWFSFFSFFYKDAFIHRFLFFLFLIPSLAAIFIAFVKVKLNFWGKLVFYSWFLVIVLSLGLFRFSFNLILLFDERNPIPWTGTLDCFLTGMAFLYILVNLVYIWELIPIPGKNQSWENRMKEWHELTNLMTDRCDDQQPTHLQTVLILVLQGGVMFLDYIFHFIPAGYLINVLILLPIALSSGRNTTKLALQASSMGVARSM